MKTLEKNLKLLHGSIYLEKNEKAQLKRAVMNFVLKHGLESKRDSRFPSFPFLTLTTRKLRFATISSAVLLIIFIASATAVAAKSTRPGNPLYPIKRVVEKSMFILASTEKKRQELQLEYAQNRLEEFEETVAYDNEKIQLEAVIELSRSLQKFRALPNAKKKIVIKRIKARIHNLKQRISSPRVIKSIIKIEKSIETDKNGEKSAIIDLVPTKTIMITTAVEPVPTDIFMPTPSIHVFSTPQPDRNKADTEDQTVNIKPKTSETKVQSVTAIPTETNVDINPLTTPEKQKLLIPKTSTVKTFVKHNL